MTAEINPTRREIIAAMNNAKISAVHVDEECVDKLFEYDGFLYCQIGRIRCVRLIRDYDSNGKPMAGTNQKLQEFKWVVKEFVNKYGEAVLASSARFS